MVTMAHKGFEPMRVRRLAGLAFLAVFMSHYVFNEVHTTSLIHARGPQEAKALGNGTIIYF